MCRVCGKHGKKKGNVKNKENENCEWVKLDDLDNTSIRMREGSDHYTQFFRIKGHLEKKLGMQVSKVTTLKHCISITDQMYQDEKGVGSY